MRAKEEQEQVEERQQSQNTAGNKHVKGAGEKAASFDPSEAQVGARPAVSFVLPDSIVNAM